MASDPRYDDWSAILAARKELGDEYDQAFVEVVVERLSAEVDQRVDARLAEAGAGLRAPRRPRRTALPFYSLVLGIPISAIAGGDGHVAGLAVAWGGIVLVNVASAWRSRELPLFVGRRFGTRATLSRSATTGHHDGTRLSLQEPRQMPPPAGGDVPRQRPSSTGRTGP
ncbi:MAG: hypothetical protein ACLQCU_01450 [Acidimicrobiales bacterium]|jgi:hypothetical protein